MRVKAGEVFSKSTCSRRPYFLFEAMDLSFDLPQLLFLVLIFLPFPTIGKEPSALNEVKEDAANLEWFQHLIERKFTKRVKRKLGKCSIEN
ncbi:MAG TPA: hypothetical protein VGC07_11260 [Granulicella sp.]